MGLSDLGEAAAVDVVTTVTEVTEDHLVLVSRILNKKPVHVIVFHLVEMIQLANVSFFLSFFLFISQPKIISLQ
jgi:hypothetical protein